jgi:hypothetical protein
MMKKVRGRKVENGKNCKKGVIYSGAQHNSSYFFSLLPPTPKRSFCFWCDIFPCGFVVATAGKKSGRVETALRTLGAFEIDGRKIFMHP